MYNPSIAVVDNFLYTCGGKYEGGGSTEIAMARCFRYDPRFDTWFEIAPMNEPRTDFVLVALNKKLYAIAGQDENKVMLSVECYDITNIEWEMKCPLTRHVYGHAGTVCMGKIYISGGQIFPGTWRKLFCYSPIEDAWQEMAPMLQNRQNHITTEVNEKLFVVGGMLKIAMDSQCQSRMLRNTARTQINGPSAKHRAIFVKLVRVFWMIPFTLWGV